MPLHQPCPPANHLLNGSRQQFWGCPGAAELFTGFEACNSKVLKNSRDPQPLPFLGGCCQFPPQGQVLEKQPLVLLGCPFCQEASDAESEAC